jgi:hypothetical protein
MYRKACGQLALKKVVAFHLLDAEFRRSVFDCLVHADDSLARDIGLTGGFVQ